jgi:hypothetical protein
MSIEAHKWLADNLADLRRLTYLEVNKKTGAEKIRPLGEPGLALLVYLCDAVSKKTGTFFMTIETMQEETGISNKRQVQRLLAAFQDWDLITKVGEIRYLGKGRPTPEYRLTCVYGVPQDSEKTLSGVPLSVQQVSPGTSENSIKRDEQRTSDILRVSEPEPQPEPHSEPQPEPELKHADGAALGGNGQLRMKEVLGLVVKFELEDYPPKEPIADPEALARHVENKYKLIVADGLEKYPESSARDLARWCITQCRGLPQHAELLADLGHCHNCNSTGKVRGLPIEREGYTYAGELVPCPACQSPTVTQTNTQTRVNTDHTVDTYLPSGTAQAYAQSLIGQLSRHMKID